MTSEQTMTDRRWIFVLAVAVLCGCASEVDGPTPAVDKVAGPTGSNVICTCDALSGCVKTEDDVLTISGSGFAPLPVGLLDQPRLELPSVVFTASSGSQFTIHGDDSSKNPPGVGITYQDDATLVLTLTPDYVKDLPPDRYTVTVVNPNGNRGELKDGLEVVLGPRVASVSPKEICPTVDQVVTITGEHFREGAQVALIDSAAQKSYPVPPADVQFVDGTTIKITIRANAVPVGTYDVQVILAEGCSHTLAQALDMVPPPTLESVSPATVCDQLETKVTLVGKDFRQGAKVIIGSTELPAADVTVKDSSTIEITVRQGHATGTFDVTVLNPEGCASTLVDALTVVPPPTLSKVEPTTVCTGGTVKLTGTGFLPGASVTIGTAVLSVSSVVVDSETSITVVVGPLAPGGPYDVTVTNADGCTSGTLTAALTVTPGPIVVAVDPSTVYNKVDFPIAIFGSGFTSGIVAEVSTTPPTALTITQVTGERIDALVPAGIPPGTYDLTVKDLAGCSYVFAGALTVTDQLTVQICGVDPPFGYTGEKTPVTITSGTGPGCSAGTQQFVSTPRAWLDIGGNLTALKSVAFVTATSLTGMVPAALTVGGPYDLLVQNPDGAIGLLAGTFKVVDKPVPLILSINPGDVDTQYVGQLVITGKDFRAPVTVELISAAGVKSLLANPVVSGAGTQVTVDLDVGTLGLLVGAYVVRVTNNDQGTYYDYPALAITNPAGNLQPWTVASGMITARRRHAMVAGRVSSAARFLYVIGGDAGTPSTPLDAVELVPLDKFGGTGTWVEQRYKLKTARTGVRAVVQGRYIHVIGGEGPAGFLTSIERAVILDPADAPEVSSFTFNLGGTLAKGAWYYRVSANMPASDLDNPGGETLPSDPVVVHAINNVKVTLTWDAVTGAVSYNIYRTPAAGGAFGGEELLATVNAPTTTYADDGTKSTSASQTPLVQGSTGVFVELTTAALQSARGDAALSKATLGGAIYVHVAGGRSSSTAVLDSVELATLSADGKTLSTFQTATNKLLSSRERLMLVVADHDTSPTVPAGTTYLYAAGGSDGTSAVSGGRVSTLGANGQPGAWADVAAIKNAPIAAAGYLINDTFYWFGGSNDGTNALGSCTSCEYVASPPAFKNCNSLGPGALPAGIARMNAALTLESAFFYLSGGGATNTTATTDVFKTVY